MAFPFSPKITWAGPALPPPNLTSAVGSGTGGTIPAGTYFYVVTATGPLGESLKSNEMSVILTGTTSSVTLGWTGSPLATGFKVWRGTATGVYSAGYVVDLASPFVDTNQARTGGALPTVDAAVMLMSQSSGIWIPDSLSQGGGSESAAGVPETYIIRRDGLLMVPLRFLETEWLMVAQWIQWCLDSGSQGFFSFYPDQAKAQNYQCWLLKPKVGERWGVKRAQGYVKCFEVDLEMRTRVVGTLFDVQVI